MVRRLSLCVPLLLLCGCGDDESTASNDGSGATSSGGAGGQIAGGASSGGSSAGGQGMGGQGTGGAPPTTFGGDRPVELLVPPSYDDASPAPLLLLLHGYSANGVGQEAYFQLTGPAHDRGMLYAVPEGTVDAGGNQFWNASDACCNFGGSTVDDAAYLRGVIEEIQGAYNVDPNRIYLVGHSNGGFMSYRMACDHADLIAGIVSLAGAMPATVADCQPSEAVNILQVHGTADEVILYDGGAILGNAYPSAAVSVASWATVGGCDGSLTADPTTMDLDTGLAGDETTVARHDNCNGGWAELWTITDGAHIPALGASWAPSILDFLLAHPKN